jgi:SAM-dependent methyltransferase
MPEFDEFSDHYNAFLKDPIRDSFTSCGGLFFHLRKRDLIRRHFERQKTDTRKLAYLDLGCGRGELACMLREEFAHVSGCDPSAAMMRSGQLEQAGVDTRVQSDPVKIPFPDETFDFVSAVCVYHHVPVTARALLTSEVARVLKPGGCFTVIEHNPFNPITRLIVSRTPVDADAVLLRPDETRSLMNGQRLEITSQRFFLYLPERLYQRLGFIEELMAKLPLGGQYAIFGRIPMGRSDPAVPCTTGNNCVIG